MIMSQSTCPGGKGQRIEAVFLPFLPARNPVHDNTLRVRMIYPRVSRSTVIFGALTIVDPFVISTTTHAHARALTHSLTLSHTTVTTTLVDAGTLTLPLNCFDTVATHRNRALGHTNLHLNTHMHGNRIYRVVFAFAF